MYGKYPFVEMKRSNAAHIVHYRRFEAHHTLPGEQKMKTYEYQGPPAYVLYLRTGFIAFNAILVSALLATRGHTSASLVPMQHVNITQYTVQVYDTPNYTLMTSAEEIETSCFVTKSTHCQLHAGDRNDKCNLYRGNCLNMTYTRPNASITGRLNNYATIQYMSIPSSLYGIFDVSTFMIGNGVLVVYNSTDVQMYTAQFNPGVATFFEYPPLSLSIDTDVAVMTVYNRFEGYTLDRSLFFSASSCSIRLMTSVQNGSGASTIIYLRLGGDRTRFIEMNNYGLPMAENKDLIADSWLFKNMVVTFPDHHASVVMRTLSIHNSQNEIIAHTISALPHSITLQTASDNSCYGNIDSTNYKGKMFCKLVFGKVVAEGADSVGGVVGRLAECAGLVLLPGGNVECKALLNRAVLALTTRILEGMDIFTGVEAANDQTFFILVSRVVIDLMLAAVTTLDIALTGGIDFFAAIGLVTDAVFLAADIISLDEYLEKQPNITIPNPTWTPCFRDGHKSVGAKNSGQPGTLYKRKGDLWIMHCYDTETYHRSSPTGPGFYAYNFSRDRKRCDAKKTGSQNFLECKAHVQKYPLPQWKFYQHSRDDCMFAYCANKGMTYHKHNWRRCGHDSTSGYQAACSPIIDIKVKKT